MHNPREEILFTGNNLRREFGCGLGINGPGGPRGCRKTSQSMAFRFKGRPGQAI